MLPHEVIDDEIELSGADVSEYCELPADNPLQASKQKWCEDLNVPENNDDISVVGMWGDSASFFTRDSIFVLLFNLLSGSLSRRRRFPICAWSKRMACQCGCQGRCTLDGIWRVTTWFMTAWACKCYPSVRDDGVRFDMSNRPGDISRAAWAKRGRRMRVRGAIGQKRGDWQWLKVAFALCDWTPEGAFGQVLPQMHG